MSKKERNLDKRIQRELMEQKANRQKKLLPILFVVILIAIAGLVTYNLLSSDYEEQQQAALDLYKNQITPEQLQTRLDNKEETYAYFFQPDCEHCKVVSPFLIPMGEELQKPLFPVDIFNKNDIWKKYNVKGTPTLIHFKDGKEVKRIVGEFPESKFREFFTQP